MLLRSRENGAELLGDHQPPQSGHIGSHSGRDLFLLRQIPHVIEGAGNDFRKVFVDLGFLPGQGLNVLDSLEVGNDDAACVGKHVGDD